MASQQQLTLKLLVDNSSDTVLFAEAGKDVVDFLFSLLSIPLGAVVKLLATEGMPIVGCIGNLYKSVEHLDDSCLQSGHVRTLLLNPTLPSASLPNNILSLTGGNAHELKFYMCTNNNCGTYTSCCGAICPVCYTQMLTEIRRVDSDKRVAAATGTALKFYRCNRGNGTTKCGINYTSCCGTVCPVCNNQMRTEMRRVDSDSTKEGAAAAASVGEAGFVKGVVTYTVTDDLTVTKLSSISSITMLAKCNVGDLGSLEERVVKIGMKEGLEILKASLQSRMVLTNVFSRDKKKRNNTSP